MGNRGSSSSSPSDEPSITAALHEDVLCLILSHVDLESLLRSTPFVDTRWASATQRVIGDGQLFHRVSQHLPFYNQLYRQCPMYSPDKFDQHSAILFSRLVIKHRVASPLPEIEAQKATEEEAEFEPTMHDTTYSVLLAWCCQLAMQKDVRVLEWNVVRWDVSMGQSAWSHHLSESICIECDWFRMESTCESGWYGSGEPFDDQRVIVTAGDVVAEGESHEFEANVCLPFDKLLAAEEVHREFPDERQLRTFLYASRLPHASDDFF